ncbi:MAG: SGNH/GDSL hydrolase family protein [Candidatus Alcyoniella australis]|nr:SGNH/GDSL hydrolase family protein [Candidatus Alcyoniella australis]
MNRIDLPLLAVFAALPLEAWLVARLARINYSSALGLGLLHTSPIWVIMLGLALGNPHREAFLQLAVPLYLLFRISFILRRRGLFSRLSYGSTLLTVLGPILVLVCVWWATGSDPLHTCAILLLLAAAVLLARPRSRGQAELGRRAAWCFLPAALYFTWRHFSIEPPPALNGWLVTLALSGPVLLGYQLVEMGHRLRNPNLGLFCVALAFLALAESLLGNSYLEPHLKPMDMGAPTAITESILWTPPANKEEVVCQIVNRLAPLRGIERAELDKPAGVYRIIAVGGSATIGDCGIKPPQAWPAQLELALHEREYDAVEVLNGGVSAFGTFQISLLVENLMVFFEPEMIIAYVGFNDQFNHPPLIRSRYNALERSWNLSPLSDPANPLAQSALIQGLSRVVEGVKIHRDINTPKQERPEDYLLNLEDIRRSCHSRSIELVLVSEPFSPGCINQYPIHRATCAFAEQSHVPLFDLKAWFDKRGHDFFAPFFFDLVHPNIQGNKFVAELIANFLVSRQLIDVEHAQRPLHDTDSL